MIIDKKGPKRMLKIQKIVDCEDVPNRNHFFLSFNDSLWIKDNFCEKIFGRRVRYVASTGKFEVLGANIRKDIFWEI